jgi:hypothetical protein
MRSTILVLLPSLLLSAGSLLEAGQGRSGEVRTIDRTSRPLAASVKPGENVRVVDVSDHPLEVLPPTRESVFEWNLQNVRSALVIQVRGKVSHVVDTGDWLESQVSADVIQVLKVGQ